MSESLNRLAILASGNGTTAEAFIEAIAKNTISGHEVGLVVCSNPEENLENGGIYSRIRNLNVKFGLDIELLHIGRYTHPLGDKEKGQQTDQESSAICERVHDLGIDHVALMGYMRIVRGDLLIEYGYKTSMDSIYDAKMSNSHPGPLPETTGQYKEGTSKKVLELDLKYSAHTHHLVAEGVDQGPIIASHPVKVLEDDTYQSLNQRVMAVEKIAMPYSIDNFLRKQNIYNLQNK